MTPGQHLQQAVVQTLDTDAQAVGHLTKRYAAAGLLQIVRVSLYSNFGVFLNLEGAFSSIQNPLDGAGGQVRGGAAAEETP